LSKIESKKATFEANQLNELYRGALSNKSSVWSDSEDQEKEAIPVSYSYNRNKEYGGYPAYPRKAKKQVAKKVEKNIYFKDHVISPASTGDNANYFDTIKSFLKHSPVYLCNLTPDENGQIIVDLNNINFTGSYLRLQVASDHFMV